jgi:hypothetical protein
MTIIKTIHEAYDAPEIKYLEVRPEGVLCQSGNTNEGVEFEDWG